MPPEAEAFFFVNLDVQRKTLLTFYPDLEIYYSKGVGGLPPGAEAFLVNLDVQSPLTENVQMFCSTKSIMN